MRVFLSYRRADDMFLAGRLSDRLADDFGDENIFFDVDSVPPGTDFREVIRDRIDAADVVLALIGSRWNAGRLALVNDFVRMELGESLRQHKPLIPVLIADTAMPGPDELPEELASMAFLNALRIRPDPDFHRDAAQLVEAITDANERELARVVEESPSRIPDVPDASRQSQAEEADLITLRDHANEASASTAGREGNAESTQDIESRSPPPDSVSSASPPGPRLASLASSEVADRLERARVSPAEPERSVEDGNGGAGLKRDAWRGRRRWIATGVAFTLVGVAVATILVATRRSDDAVGRLGPWVAQVTDDNGDASLRTDDGNDLVPGTEPAWDAQAQLLAFVPTSGTDGCGICGLNGGSDTPVELVSVSPDGTLHAPTWSRSGSIYYARTKNCDPAPNCGDEIRWTRRDAPTSSQLLPSPNLRGVRDLEVDPWSTDDSADIRFAIVDADGARLMSNGISDPLSNGGDVADLTYSANTHVIVGLTEGRPQPALEVWNRTGESIATVDLRQLLTAGDREGFDTGLDIATVEANSVSPTGSSSDQKFVVALRDGSEQVGAVEMEVPYNADATAQLEVTPRVSGLVSIPYTLHRGAMLNELVQLRGRDD
jgi:TIR domain